MTIKADSPVNVLKGVGPALSQRLSNLGIEHVVDLLLHRPSRYEDRTHITPLTELVPGVQALIVARVEHAEQRQGQRRSLLVSVTDGRARLSLRFFHYAEQQVRGFVPGAWLRAFGEVRAGPQGLEIVHPEYRLVADQEAAERVAPSLTPVYPTTSGLGQGKIRDLVALAIALLDEPGFLPDALPEEIRADQNVPTLHAALRGLHQPKPDADVAALIDGTHPAIRRLAFAELVAHQASLRQRRRQVQAHAAPALNPAGTLMQAFFDQLGFVPTGAQKRVIGEVLGDIACTSPMLRLLQGDVGSGKTVVAAAAGVTAFEAGWQTALMAPTELLAEQHFASLDAWLTPLGIPVWLLTGSRNHKQTREAIAAGHPGVVVGTHALFQDASTFGSLGLTVVDEQHRFGVHQRLALRDKAGDGVPHQLTMTATPIPRTLAMSAYADLDTSVIDELPPGRTPVTTVAIPDHRRDAVIERIAAACAQQRQVYWVCTLIEASETSEARAAEATAEELSQALGNQRIGLAHGRMKAVDKEAVMRAFKAGELDVLVATTVIEVGVDVPNASLMVIENAERLGLAQLHQLRGRVGRGDTASHCVLLYEQPLNEIAHRRLAALRESNDGFRIAREDLQLRGPGEVLGARQTGAVQFRIADLMRDADLAPAAQAAADRMLTAHPEAVRQLIARWTTHAEEYASV